VPRSLLLLWAALVCAVIALLIALGVTIVGDWQEWLSGAFVAYFGSLIP
jgi:hypothetical protein